MKQLEAVLQDLNALEAYQFSSDPERLETERVLVKIAVRSILLYLTTSEESKMNKNEEKVSP